MTRRASIRTRVVVAILALLALTLGMASVIVDRLYTAQLDDLSTQALADQRREVMRGAKTVAEPRELLEMTEDTPVSTYIRLRDGRTMGVEPPASTLSDTFTVEGDGEVNLATITLYIDEQLKADSLRVLRRSLLIVDIAVLLAAAMLALVVVDVALKPLNALGAAADRIAEGERGLRFEPDNPDTEIGRAMHAIDDMLDELEGAERRAQQAELEAKASAEQMQSFLSDAAHELKTPLAGIQAAAEALSQMGPKADLADREHLEFLLVREANRGGELVASLLEAARVDAGVALQRMDIDLFELIRNERDRLALTHPKLVVVLEGGSLVVNADRNAITSSLRNLVDNAARAAGPTGVIGMCATRIDDMGIVDVVNTGEPIAEVDRERIFERLVRLSNVATTTRGSGLGLPIARGYARAHGGDITYTVGSGLVEAPHDFASCFRLELPLAYQEVALPDEPVKARRSN